MNLRIVIPFVLMTALVLAWSIVSPPTESYGNPHSRDDGYLDFGRRWSETGRYSNLDGSVTTWRLPLYPGIIAALFTIQPEQAPRLIKGLQRIALGLSVALLSSALWQRSGWLAGAAAAAFFILDPFFYHVGERFTQTAGSLLLVSLLLMSTRASTGAQLAVVPGLCALWRPAHAILGLVLAGLRLPTRRRAWLTLVGLAMATGIWSVRNWNATGQAAPLGSAGTTAIYACYADDVFTDPVSRFRGHSLDPQVPEKPEPVRFAMDQCRRHGPLLSANVFALRLLRMVLPYTHVPRESWAKLPLILFKGAILLLGWVGFFRVLRSPHRADEFTRLCCAGVLLALAQSLLTHADPRILYSFMPFWLGLAFRHDPAIVEAS